MNDIPLGGSVLSLKDSYLEKDFHVTQTDDARLEFGTKIALTTVGLSALFYARKTTISRKTQIKNIDHAHVFWLRYMILTSSKRGEDLAIGFNWDVAHINIEMIRDKHNLRELLVGIFLKIFFGFAEKEEVGP